MNPYDFVPLDLSHPPQRRRPVWHHMLTHSDRLYSGYLYVYMKTMTPLFIGYAGSSVHDARYPGQHMQDEGGAYIIPGTSLKGMLRSVVEALCSGCLAVFRSPREYMHDPLPRDFARCNHNTSLCISCRLFGMMQAGQRNAEVFLGKVNIGDAYAYDDTPALYEPIYTPILEAPKPRHRAFYLDQQGRYIAGRKFYFHHGDEPLTEHRLIENRNKPGQFRNQHIQPLDSGVDFSARIDFTNLEADEFAALLLAITLQPDMYHKIGYGKPIGLGSIQLIPTELKLVDYAQRYKNFRAGHGISLYTGDELTDLLDEQMEPLDTRISAALHGFRTQPSLAHLHRIWQWPPDDSVVYSYPSQRWFKDNPTARISATADLYPDD